MAETLPASVHGSEMVGEGEPMDVPIWCKALAYLLGKTGGCFKVLGTSFKLDWLG